MNLSNKINEKNDISNNKFIDSHFHPIDFLDLFNEKEKKTFKLNEIFKVINTKALNKLICVSTKFQDVDIYYNLSNDFEIFSFSAGIHPCELNENYLNEINEIGLLTENFIKNNKKIVAIGEIGIDFFYQKDNFLNQKKAFELQIEIALNNNLPIIIHTRNAMNETFEILNSYKSEKLRGVIHCFCNDYFWAKKFVDINFKLGIGGVLTYPKNEEIRDAVKKIGAEHILYETDAPFLPLQKYRGKINSPEYIPELNKFLAEIYQIDEFELAEKIYKNTIDLFFK